MDGYERIENRDLDSAKCALHPFDNLHFAEILCGTRC